MTASARLLARLTTADSDDRLLTAIRQAPGLVDMAQRGATLAYQTARAIDGAPWVAIDQAWADARAAAAAPTLFLRSEEVAGRANTDAIRRAELTLLRGALAASERFNALHAKIDAMDMLSRRRFQAAENLRAEDEARRKQMAAHQAAHSAPGHPKVSIPEFLARLSGRGVSLSVGGDGIHARPAGLLTAADREVLRAHKPDVIAALGGDELVA